MADWALPCVFVANMMWHKFLQLYTTVPRLLSAFESSTPVETRHKGVPVHINAFVSCLAELSQQERMARLKALVLEHVTAVAGDELQLSSDEPLMEAGLDSLAAIELRNQLSRILGDAPLSAGMLFDHPTVSRVCAFGGVGLRCNRATGDTRGGRIQWSNPTDATALGRRELCAARQRRPACQALEPPGRGQRPHLQRAKRAMGRARVRRRIR